MSLDTSVDPAAPPQVPGEPAEELLLRDDLIEAGPDEELQEEAPPAVLRTVAAAVLAASGAAWMISSIFRGFPLPFLVSLVGVGLGAAVAGLSHGRRITALQYLLVPVALLGGAVVTAPHASGGADLPRLVMEAITSGGLLQAPVSFDPGWHFLLVVIFTIFTGGAASLAIVSRKPRLAVGVPVPLTVMGGLVQPPEGVVLAAAVAAGLTMLALSVAFGADLASRADTGPGFELRRLARGSLVALLSIAALLIISRVGILFPEPDRDQVVPPTRPQVPAAVPDTELFRVQMARVEPLRLGTIDVYDVTENAWLLPAFDPEALRRFDGGSIPGVEQAPTENTATITIADQGGHVLPTVSNATSLELKSGGQSLEYEPTTQTVRAEDRLSPDIVYTVSGPGLPTGKELEEAGEPAAAVLPYAEAPAPPDQVHELLLKAPDNPWLRLQYMRTQLYSNVVAAGQGSPTDLPVSRVVEMLAGGEASPYEITAADALIARWAGVPARIGYGYYPQIADQSDDGSFSIRPRHGATWLEAYFEGHGWIPIVGVPAKAKASTSNDQKNEQLINPSEDLSLIVYVTADATSRLLLYQVVLYWIGVSLPILLLLVLMWLSYPALLKWVRRRRRARWALEHGEAGRIAVAYAEFRDLARDLTIGDPADTPLMFRGALQPDAEHEELAWLVTRALWGDLQRDLRPEDAEAAEKLSASLRRRLRQGQPGLYVTLSRVARDSLREPYWPELPNVWPRVKGRKPRLRMPRWRLIPRPAMSLFLLAFLLTGCGDSAVSARELPDELAPTELSGLKFEREPEAESAFQEVDRSLVSEGRVFSIRRPSDERVIGSLQLSLYKPGVYTGNELFKDVQGSIGVDRFRRTTIDGQRAYYRQLPEQTIVLWFPPGNEVMALLVVVSPHDDELALPLAEAIVQHGQGKEPDPLPSLELGT